MDKNKRAIIQILLNVICLVVVVFGSLSGNGANLTFNIVLIAIISLAIIIQLIAYAYDKKNK